jgi:8-oxo-dGTP diphosphatase
MVALHDGNGWVECRCGQRHWGRHGATGLLVLRPAADAGRGLDDLGPEPTGLPAESSQLESPVEVLLQLRAGWTHQGGSWALPGGARDSHEDIVTAALREAREETGIDAADLSVIKQIRGVEHGDWSYTYVIAIARTTAQVVVRNAESDELRWVPPSGVSRLPLLPAFGVAWPALALMISSAVPGSPPPPRPSR